MSYRCFIWVGLDESEGEWSNHDVNISSVQPESSDGLVLISRVSLKRMNSEMVKRSFGIGPKRFVII
jgi:hypothetical protein